MVGLYKENDDFDSLKELNIKVHDAVAEYLEHESPLSIAQVWTVIGMFEDKKRLLFRCCSSAKEK